MPRLRRVRIDSPGWTRTRAGDGFVYLDTDRTRLTDPEAIGRISSLAIPPAWQDVWICPWPGGHIQAAGVDAAGRRQYLYHAQWRLRRDRAKHDHVLEIARRLPDARKQVEADLDQTGWPRSRALALAFRLLDLAYFRAGNETYARTNGSYGLATLRREHVQVRGDRTVRFLYPAKSGQVRDVVVAEPDVARLVTSLRRRTGGGEELLAWRDGRTWYDISSADVTAYVKDVLGHDASPKDFRTWHATVLAARGLADAGAPPTSDRARRKVVTGVVRDVSEALGNTPAVCRASYIDPRLVDLWERGESIGRTRSRDEAERAVLELLSD
ncbi:DNA topoisomerase IB [uncultured Cellulomonas sp.]|uniref:DNA topoisomerase IB n=1 Tax=uncultured Cellulomonas sp. TaxID=189682 RepID=UPI00261775CB|nr:DNA topoisomerase IB [uncultured Cellulomonas sp.]